jgi:hypothetical protein
MSETKPKILIVYYTYTQQNSRVRRWPKRSTSSVAK